MSIFVYCIFGFKCTANLQTMKLKLYCKLYLLFAIPSKNKILHESIVSTVYVSVYTLNVSLAPLFVLTHKVK